VADDGIDMAFGVAGSSDAEACVRAALKALDRQVTFSPVASAPGRHKVVLGRTRNETRVLASA
jgi:hypothetical protein